MPVTPRFGNENCSTNEVPLRNCRRAASTIKTRKGSRTSTQPCRSQPWPGQGHLRPQADQCTSIALGRKHTEPRAKNIHGLPERHCRKSVAADASWQIIVMAICGKGSPSRRTISDRTAIARPQQQRTPSWLWPLCLRNQREPWSGHRPKSGSCELSTRPQPATATPPAASSWPPMSANAITGVAGTAGDMAHGWATPGRAHWRAGRERGASS
mmetsp:Transcript_18232/g.50027  ORF Transcript_18232/g.50027 Transcript_18232/m.50027 type:complete len:213 (-) Transcript_18232:1-639(-)